jgi:two-component system, NtrC family, response regulator HydG
MDPATGWLGGTMEQAATLARRAARSDATVLVTGESGTGKEIISQLVHVHSDRAARPMVCVNCAALPESLIESELFGHRRGAFTGADTDRVGCFELSSGGTLLLDEISEIPLHLQAKLLRVLENRKLQRVGSNELIDLDLRVVATSNRSLQGEVAAGRFRLDLLHRLRVIEVDLPPLRERRHEIRPLAHHFLRLVSRHRGSPAGIAETALQRLEQHHWPGNVREMRNVIHRACVLAESPMIQCHDLGDLDPPVSTSPSGFNQLGQYTLAELEQAAIAAALQRFRGNRVAAARALGVSARTIFNKLRLYAAHPAGDPNQATSTPARHDAVAPAGRKAA